MKYPGGHSYRFFEVFVLNNNNLGFWKKLSTQYVCMNRLKNAASYHVVHQVTPARVGCQVPEADIRIIEDEWSIRWTDQVDVLELQDGGVGVGVFGNHP